MIRYRCILSTGKLTYIEIDPAKENMTYYGNDFGVDYWFGDRFRNGRQFIDVYGWSIMPEHIVMWKREED